MNSPFQFNPLNNDAHNNIKNYKIAKCKNWEQDKTCRYGNKCTFAHGDEEIRHKKIKKLAKIHDFVIASQDSDSSIGSYLLYHTALES
jgi:hypothetical protein